MHKRSFVAIFFMSLIAMVMLVVAAGPVSAAPFAQTTATPGTTTTAGTTTTPATTTTAGTTTTPATTMTAGTTTTPATTMTAGTTTTPATTSPTTTAPSTLPQTGSDDGASSLPLGTVALILFAVGIATLIATRFSRRTRS